MFSQERLHYFYLYISCSAIFFMLGLAVCYLLPQDSSIYISIQNKVTDTVYGCSSFTISSVIASFTQETKFVLFAFIATFCIHRHSIFFVLNAYKGISSGICTSCFLRIVKNGIINARFEVFGCFIFTALSVASVCLLCLYCAHSIIYSKKLMYPVKLKSTLKRKDTIAYIFDTLAFSGAVLIIILLKHGNLLVTVSSKGM